MPNLAGRLPSLTRLVSFFQLAVGPSALEPAPQELPRMNLRVNPAYGALANRPEYQDPHPTH